jgi:hypothetical protein
MVPVSSLVAILMLALLDVGSVACNVGWMLAVAVGQ